MQKFSLKLPPILTKVREQRQESHPLKKLSKLELFELLAEQEREIQRLREELEEKDRLLAEREIKLARAGSIAEAALQLNGVFEAAQAADQYVSSVMAQQRAALRREVREKP